MGSEMCIRDSYYCTLLLGKTKGQYNCLLHVNFLIYKLLLGHKKLQLFTFREPPLNWKNNFKLQNVMVAIKTVQIFSNESTFEPSGEIEKGLSYQEFELPGVENK